MKNNVIGILGSVDLSNTTYLLQEIARKASAANHFGLLPAVVFTTAQIPRHGAGATDMPVASRQAREDVVALEAKGAGFIAILASMSHQLVNLLREETSIPMLTVAEAACNVLRGSVEPGAAIGLLAPLDIVYTCHYQTQLAMAGYSCMLNTKDEISLIVARGIDAVNRGEIHTGGRLLDTAATRLRTRGCAALVMASPEIAAAMMHIDSANLDVAIDAPRELAACSVNWWLKQSTKSTLTQQLPGIKTC